MIAVENWEGLCGCCPADVGTLDSRALSEGTDVATLGSHEL